MRKNKEAKIEKWVFPAVVLETKEEGDVGIVKAIVNVFGIIDLMDDIVEPGAFVKTISERQGKIRVLDNHNTSSVTNVVGKPISIREIGRDEILTLAPNIVQKHPMTTGGLYTETQYMLDDDKSAAVYKRIKHDFINEYSIGFNILDQDHKRVKNDEGKDVVVRRIKTVRLLEYSPVIWGANQATGTTGVKNEDIDPPADSPAPDEDKEHTPDGPQRRMGDQLSAAMHGTFIQIASGYLSDGMVDGDEYKRMCECADALLLLMKTMLPEDLRLRPMPDFNWFFFSDGVPDDLKAEALALQTKINASVNEQLTDNEDGANMDVEEQSTPDSPSADLAGPPALDAAAPTKSDDELRVKLTRLELELLEVSSNGSISR